MDTPRPFKQDDVEEVFWKPEPWDPLIPEGFCSDFTLHLRGIETPIPIQLWSSLWIVSSMIRRDAFIDRFPMKLFPNIYVVVVAPPRRCAKSTAANYAEGIFRNSINRIKSPILRYRKSVKIVHGRITSEALPIILAPRSKDFIVDGKTETIHVGSEAVLSISELEVLLSKEKYKQGLIGRLTDLYDCKEVDDDTTVSRGEQVNRDICVTLFGATTPSSLEKTIPDEAFGGGFLSRTILVVQETTPRRFPTPLPVKGGPTIEDLEKRLAWIAETAKGPYTLSPDAEAWYAAWYERFMNRLDALIHASKRSFLLQRYDTNLLKIALLIRAQRYEPGNVITVKDLIAASKILEETYKGAEPMVEGVGGNDWLLAYTRVVAMFKRAKKMTRRQLMAKCSPMGYPAALVDSILNNLYQEGKLQIELDNVISEKITRMGNEIYRWVGSL